MDVAEIEISFSTPVAVHLYFFLSTSPPGRWWFRRVRCCGKVSGGSVSMEPGRPSLVDLSPLLSLSSRLAGAVLGEGGACCGNSREVGGDRGVSAEAGCDSMTDVV